MKSQSIEHVDVRAFRIPTNHEESDGTLAWDQTELVLVEVGGGGQVGIGWSYAPIAAGQVVSDILRHAVTGADARAVELMWQRMQHQTRNAGRPGLGMMAISAVDVALWDLKAKLLGVPLLDLFGAARDAVMIYGSGGFTSYTEAELTDQLHGWAEVGLTAVKMKVGRDADADPKRVQAARGAIGDNVQLFVDANGGYSRKQALALAERFAAESDVTWFEEPRPSDDLEGLRLMRDRAPAGMDIAAGEYGDTLTYFQRMLTAGAVDCLQADVTRCGGYTGFLKVAALCEANCMPLSAHCAPQLHSHVACACAPVRHVEYFHDHVRIADMIFDGVLQPKDGKLMPDRSRVGHGLSLKKADAEKFRI